MDFDLDDENPWSDIYIPEDAIDLDLYDYKLTRLSPEIGQLTKLEYLNASKNRLTSLPTEIGLLTRLTRLDLSDNRLTSLFPEVGRLTQLAGLYLGKIN